MKKDIMITSEKHTVTIYHNTDIISYRPALEQVPLICPWTHFYQKVIHYCGLITTSLCEFNEF